MKDLLVILLTADNGFDFRTNQIYQILLMTTKMKRLDLNALELWDSESTWRKAFGVLHQEKIRKADKN